MNRIAIIGCCGAGKSTLARALGDRLRLPVVHLDKLFWKAGWVESAPDDFDRRLEAVTASDRWIIDGNYSRTLPARLVRADAVILMNFPTLACLLGIAQRRIRYHGTVRPDLPEGCPEKLDLEFVRFVAGFRRETLPRVRAAIREHAQGKTVVELHSRREARAWLRTVGG